MNDAGHTTQRPRPHTRLDAAMLVVSGVTGLAAWIEILLYFRTGRVHEIAAVGIVLTVVMLGAATRSLIVRKRLTTASLVLSLSMLLLGIIAMALAVF